jgi:purine-binding chemotaxis protein CheW
MAEEVLVTEKQLVVFDLGGEAYGVDISTVREIIRMQAITVVPGTPHAVEGIINIRGSVIPVVDLRKRFGLEDKERGKETRIVVVTTNKGQEIGVIVDSVDEVLRIPSDTIEPPSSTITGADSAYLLGIVKLPDRLIILVDAQRMLSRQDEALLADIVEREKAKSSPGEKESVKAEAPAGTAPAEDGAVPSSTEKVLAKT